VNFTKLLSTTAALCALSTLSVMNVQAETTNPTKLNGHEVARSSGANTNSDYSRDKMYPNRSNDTVMDHQRTMMMDNKHKAMKDMRKNKHVTRLNQAKVKEVQEALDSRGYAVGAVDGLWGPKTSGALRDFQSSQGIEATGRTNTETFNALGIQIDKQTRDSMYSE